MWDEDLGTYLDPATGEVLPTWDQALDAIGPNDKPLHVARFGTEFHAEGVLAGSKDAARCIRYLTKYLTKHVADCHQADTDAQRAHAARLAEALRYEPCSPTCANWLRYGVQPKNARAGPAPGRCKGKAHRPEHLGYAGRRVLVSRKWSGKTLADHRADSKAWLLGHPRHWRHPTRPGTPGHVVTPSDHDHLPPTSGCCTSSPTAPVASRNRRSQTKSRGGRQNFRQLGRRRAAECRVCPTGRASRMLALGELCEWLNITERHARKLVERDAIPYRKVGHLLRFAEAEIEEWSRPRAPPHCGSTSRRPRAPQVLSAIPKRSARPDGASQVADRVRQNRRVAMSRDGRRDLPKGITPKLRKQGRQAGAGHHRGRDAGLPGPGVGPGAQAADRADRRGPGSGEETAGRVQRGQASARAAAGRACAVR